ncbi:hypothetical protein [Persephonella sp.]
MYLKKLLLILLVVFSVGYSAVHHHHDGRVHLDCPVCLFQINNLSDGSVESFETVILQFPSDIYFPESQVLYFQRVISYIYQRAPPLSDL